MLCEPCQGRVNPRRLLCGRHEQDEQECPDGGHQESEEDGEGRRSPQRRDTRRRELVGRSRERFTTSNDGQRLRESKHIHERSVEEPPAGQADARRRRYGESGNEASTVTRERDHTDDRRERKDSDPNPDGSRPEIMVDVTADARAQPQPPDHDDGDERREILRAHRALEAQARDGHHHDIGDVVSDHHRRQCAEHETLDQRDSGCRSGGAPAERVRDAAGPTHQE